MIQKYKLREKGVKGGGYDLLEPTHRSCSPTDQIDFTIDQQPYLQGFYPVLELFLYQASKTLTGIGRGQHRPEVPDQGDRRCPT